MASRWQIHCLIQVGGGDGLLGLSDLCDIVASSELTALGVCAFSVTR